MKINKHNIEAWLLDYMEGNLDTPSTAELMAFLAENPEYEQYLTKKEDLPLLSQASYSFESKGKLRKSYADVVEITTANFEEFCIAATEGLLDQHNTERLDHFIAGNPQLKSTYDLYRKLRLRPDRDLTFTGKSRLKKQEKRIFSVQRLSVGLAIAASVAMFIFLISKYSDRSIIPPDFENSAQLSQVETSHIQSIPETAPSPDKTVSETPRHPKNSAINRESLTEGISTSTVTKEEPVNRENVILREIMPVTQVSLTPVTSKDLATIQLAEVSVPATMPETTENTGDETLFSMLISKVDLWKTAETAINGFNQLTESKLAINKITDEQGKFERLQVRTESYTISSSDLK